VNRRLKPGLAGGIIGVGAVVLQASPAAADVPGAGIVRDVVSGASGWAFGNIASGVAGWVLGAVADLVTGVVGFLGSSAQPHLDALWFSGPGSPFATVRAIAISLLLAFVFLAVLQGLLAGESYAGAGRVVRDLVLAVLGMVAIITVAAKLLDLTDGLSSAVLGGAQDQSLRFLSRFATTAGLISGGFGAVLVGLVVAVAALLVWIELLIRSALIYLLVALSPLAFAAMTWPAARGVLRRTVELLLAVIVSKFVICVAIAVGAAALGGAGATGAVGEVTAGASPATADLGALLSGAAILALAAFSPFVVLKLLPFAEAAVAAQGISRSPVRGAQTGMSTYYYASSLGRLAGGGRGPASAMSGVDTVRTGGNGSTPLVGADGAAGAGAAGAAAAGGAGVAAQAAKRPGAAAQGLTGPARTPAPPTPPQESPRNGNGSGGRP
jgi:hypothetical protein